MVYTPPEYPAAIPDQITDLPDQTDDIDWIEAWIYNYVKKELIAVMTELGTDPAGTEATVAARLTAIEAAGVDESVILNIYLNSFRIAILGSYAVMNMVKGISDEYEDETGIDTGTSENESYDSDNDLYSPSSGAVTLESQVAGTSDAISILGDSANTEYRHAQSFLLGAEKTISSIEIEFATLLGDPSGNVTCRIETDTAGSPSGTLAHANATKVITPSASSWNVFDFTDFTLSAGTYWIVLECDDQATSNGWWLMINTDAESYPDGTQKYTSAGGAWLAATNDLNFKVIAAETTDNMTLVSEKFTADAESDDGRIVIFEEDVDAITLNTDIKAYVSRDDGTTWTQITLTDEGNYSGSKRILTGEADISAQPSGTDMVYKIESLNTKDLKIHGTALSWA